MALEVMASMGRDKCTEAWLGIGLAHRSEILSLQRKEIMRRLKEIYVPQ